MPDAILDARDIRKSYGSIVALNGVSLALARGELFGLLGPNGAGKTTLLSILAGLLAADGGTVTLDGRPFTNRDRDLKKRVGLGTQDLAVYPELTARENLRFFGRLYEIEAGKLEMRIHSLLHAVGLTDRADTRVRTYSGGMKRRLNLAVAVVHEPDVLFLDEPTTGVDPQSRFHIFELVKSLNAAGTTIVYTSHYMEEVQTLCPRIAILDHGQVKACDTISSLLQSMDATLTLEGVPATDAIAAAFRTLPGVTKVAAKNGGLELTADATGPLLPKVAEVLRQQSLSPSAMTVNEPTLEKVFLHLTGHALRD